ncbi:MAG TPA: hypothetical protein VL356_11440 [Acidocella sp.]|jgi:hypothetical protein|nr:hypothetical protein [Acidocella sp.]
MATTGGTQGGSHEQHVKAGSQSHKNTKPSGKSASSRSSREKTGSSPREGSEQQEKSGQQKPKSS